jgi:hypothetical protein
MAGRRLKSGRKETIVRDSRAKSPMEKASYHNVLGAGRSKIKREFFALNAKDFDEIGKLLDSRLSKRLKQTQ